MKIWELSPHKPWKSWYDKAFGFVIAAETSGEARKIADLHAGDENKEPPKYSRQIHPWLDPAITSCKVLKRKKLE